MTPPQTAQGVAIVLFMRSTGAARETKARILDHLRILPGDRLGSISRTLSMSRGRVRHALRELEDEGLVRKVRQRHQARYTTTEPGPQASRNVLFLRYWELCDIRARIAYALQRQSAASARDVSSAIGVSRQLATYHLIRLADEGRVARERGTFRALPTGAAMEPGAFAGEGVRPDALHLGL